MNLFGYTVEGKLLTPTVEITDVGVAENPSPVPPQYWEAPSLHRYFLEVISDLLIWLPADVDALRRGVPDNYRKARPGVDRDNNIFGFFLNSQLSRFLRERFPTPECDIWHEGQLPDLANRLDVMVHSSTEDSRVIIETDNARSSQDQLAVKFIERAPYLSRTHKHYCCMYVALIYATDRNDVKSIPDKARRWVETMQQVLHGSSFPLRSVVLHLKPTGRELSTDLVFSPYEAIEGWNDLLLPSRGAFSVFQWCLENPDAFVVPRRDG